MSTRRRRACVKLLCELGLFEDAVSLALDIDLELAKAVANTPEDDDGLRRKLWLSIAKHVVQGGSGAAAAAADAGKGAAAASAAAAAEAGPEQAERIKMAVEFLKEAGRVAAAAVAYTDVISRCCVLLLVFLAVAVVLLPMTIMLVLGPYAVALGKLAAVFIEATRHAPLRLTMDTRMRLLLSRLAGLHHSFSTSPVCFACRWLAED